MEDHSRLLLVPWWYLRIHVLGAQPSTSTGAGPITPTRAERMRQYQAKRKLKEGPLERARRAARFRRYRAQRKESGQYDPAKEALRKRQYRARKKLEARQPAEAPTAEKLRKDAERKRLYRARKKLEAQLAAASSGLPLPERTFREKMEALQQRLVAAGESPCHLVEGADPAAVTVPKRKYRPKKKAESQLGGVDGPSLGSSEKAPAAQRKRQYKPRNKLLGERGQ